MAEQPTVFVAYPYNAFSEADYRGAFAAIAAEFGVRWVYADERITSLHILEKIEAMMTEADLSLFDITTWNANVSLELGVAIGKELDYYILFNPTIAGGDVPADLGGIDRIQFEDYAGLREGLAKLMRQQFGSPEPEVEGEPAGSRVVEQIEDLRAKVPEVVRAEPGLQIGGIASALGVPLDFTQLVVKPLVGEQLVTRGVKRGTRYYPPEEAPPEHEDVSDEEIESESEERTS